MINPFLLTGFHSKKYFCDREKELASLFEHLENERNIVLYSWRRLGKTALIRYFLSILEAEKRADTVYVDLLGTRDMQTAIRYISQAVFDRFGRTESGISATFQKFMGSAGLDLTFDPVSGSPKIGFGIRSPVQGSTSLNSLGNYLMQRKKRAIIVIDEFQQVTRYPDEDGESVFRSWMQLFPGIRFIFCGSHRHMMVSMFSEKNRPFYLSAQLLHLDTIDKQMYMRFIRRLFKAGGKTIDNESLESIFAWSRMQTYCIQLVCNKLFGRYDKVGPEDLGSIYGEILDQEVLFSQSTQGCCQRHNGKF